MKYSEFVKLAYRAAPLMFALLGVSLSANDNAYAQSANGKVTTAAPTYVNGATSPLSLDTAGSLRIGGQVGVSGGSVGLLSGSANIGVTGVAQGTAIGTVFGDMVQGSVTTAAPTYVTGLIRPLSLDTAGNVRVTNTTALAAGTNVIGALAAGSNNIGDVGDAQNQATAGQIGPLVQGAVTTNGPTYTTGNSNPLSIDTAGSLRVTQSSPLTVYTIAALSVTTAQVVKASAGILYSYDMAQTGVNDVLTIFDNASACSGTVIYQTRHPGTNLSMYWRDWPQGIAFANGLTYCLNVASAGAYINMTFR